MKKNVKLLEMVAMFSVALASCTNDELKEVYRGEKISFTTRMTRAAETNTGNLKEFKVYADVDGYNMFINGEIAKKNGDSYYTDNSHFWPTDIEKMKFWAYAPTDIESAITSISQVFTDYTPDAEIATQKDFVVAYEEISRDQASGMVVPLKFHHALSQIEVNALCPSSDKQVYIKGAWIMGVHSKGTLQFSADKKDQNYMSWTTNTELDAHYGQEITPSLLGKEKASLLASTAGSSNLMLVPQEVNGYKFATQEQSATPGAYILLLCRVEAWHVGAAHPGTTNDPLIKQDKDKHIHQLFPYTAKYNDKEYGYTCVSVDVNWKPGTKYVYNLEFCGSRSGAGVYPPITKDDLETLGLPHEEIDIVTLPDGKKAGDPVLDQPISFSVTVEDWTESTAGQPMN